MASALHMTASEVSAVDVHARIKKNGSSLAAIGRELGRTRQHVWAVLYKGRQSRRVEEALAEAAGLSREEFYRLRKAA